MTDEQPRKGRLLFFPEGSDDAYEIDINVLLEEFKEPTWWEKIKNFFTGGRKKEPSSPVPLTPVRSTYVSISHLVCKMLEDLLSTAKWYPKRINTDASLILEIYPQEDETGWEPMVTIATPSGQAVDLGLSDLLFHYDPEVGGVDDDVGRIIHN